MDLLLALQRKGDEQLRRGLAELLSSTKGVRTWLDFVEWRCPEQMLLVLRRGRADTISRRNLRRQLAFLLYRLLRWRLPGRNRLRELFETLPV